MNQSQHKRLRSCVLRRVFENFKQKLFPSFPSAWGMTEAWEVPLGSPAPWQRAGSRVKKLHGTYGCSRQAVVFWSTSPDHASTVPQAMRHCIHNAHHLLSHAVIPERPEPGCFHAKPAKTDHLLELENAHSFEPLASCRNNK